MVDRILQALVMLLFVGLLVGLITAPLWLGWTYQQRCEKAFTDPVLVERCVIRLNNGGPIYEENIGYVYSVR